MPKTIFAYKSHFFGHPKKFVQKKCWHKRYHGSFEALITEIVASRTEKSGSDICLQCIGDHKYKTFSTSPVEESVMKNEGFWHKKIIQSLLFLQIYGRIIPCSTRFLYKLRTKIPLFLTLVCVKWGLL